MLVVDITGLVEFENVYGPGRVDKDGYIESPVAIVVDIKPWFLDELDIPSVIE
jgi:hypothetical protein